MARRGRAAGPSSKAAILRSAHSLLIEPGAADGPSVGAVAARAGVSRLTVYHHFGSRAGLFDALAAGAGRAAGTPISLRDAVEAACAHWATEPALFRRLPASAEADPATARELAARLAAADALRPGCSLREAEDVIAIVTSFAAFERLHHDGRRAPAAVADVLVRMARSVLGASAYD